jgi:hypothetical protein
MIDISSKDVLEKYLLERNIINAEEGYSFHYCKGGVSGTVVFVYAGKKPIIIKQALAQLKVKEEWHCDPNRMGIEYKSNEIYHRLVPDCAPAVYFYDDKNYIYGREAVPENCSMWKTDLFSGLLDFHVAEKSIRTLLMVHEKCAGDAEVAAMFADKQIFYELRISPYIEFLVDKYPHLKNFAAPIIKELMESSITLIHGDYSPKNIMTIGRNISVLDYEVACYGHPVFDLAFFAAHFVLKAVKHKQWAGAYISMLKYMLEIYFTEIRFMNAANLEEGFIKLLALLLLARIDGKSPAEYIDAETDKELVRKMAFEIIQNKQPSYKKVLSLFLENICS